METIVCPHCQSKDTVVLHHDTYLYASVKGPKGRKNTQLHPYVCLDCGMVFVKKEDLQAVRESKAEQEGGTKHDRERTASADRLEPKPVCGSVSDPGSHPAALGAGPAGSTALCGDDDSDHLGPGEGTAGKKIMYLGNCDEMDCEHWSWCGDSYDDRNTECFCRVNGKSVIRREAEEKRILCPLGKVFDDDEEV